MAQIAPSKLTTVDTKTLCMADTKLPQFKRSDAHGLEGFLVSTVLSPNCKS